MSLVSLIISLVSKNGGKYKKVLSHVEKHANANKNLLGLFIQKPDISDF